MMNKTSATLMLQTIMVLMEKQNASDVTNFPGSYGEDIERCYGIYGCFSKAYPWTENRPDNYFPVPPEAMGVRYPTFSRRNRKIPVLLEADNVDKIQNANIDPRGPFYVISHGFIDGGHKKWIENMVNALLNLEGNNAATVFIVDWRGGAQPPYGQAVANIRLVGVMTAHLIHHIYEVLGLSNLDNFHFIGHSLGAHLGGYCGHALQKKYNLKLGRITGLDPAAPYFSKTVTLVRLDRSDAKYVDVIHSNAVPLYFSGFGITEPIGHVDFYPNGGSTQPGCKSASQQRPSGDIYQQVLRVSCNHERSYEYFTESIAPSCPFLAVQCDSYDTFLAGNCTTCDHKHLCVPMGYHSHDIYKRLHAAELVDTNSNVALYLMTGGAKPYCRAHYEVKMKVSNSSESHTHGPETGKLSITLVDRNNNKSDTRFLDDEQKYYKPGDIETRMVAVKDTGHPPLSVIVEWKYETNLFNPMTWRILKSPSIFIDYMKISSIEYNTDITVCPKMNKPVVANLPTMMKTKYCKFNK
ncbi:pancreatic lipase-related protein 2-like isoform X1 [Plodia interpunctella]|uniref:pancreatic lipase-related protein 2-like isoform X1 n=1 Tax=Plodia interpunctella TaxID=58824 RepID=UPI002368C1AB|nr:pancreatic lipase-related protein 2-like isoform X1 [Plodia interpunctella]